VVAGTIAPSNSAVERPAGSHSLAAAAHREGYANKWTLLPR